MLHAQNVPFFGAIPAVLVDAFFAFLATASNVPAAPVGIAASIARTTHTNRLT